MIGEFIDDVERFLKRWLPRFDPSERSYLTVAIGCTGGRHRSVFTAEQMAQVLTAEGYSPSLVHRNLTARAADAVEGKH